MRLFFLLIALLWVFSLLSQTTKKSYFTTKYSGKYTYGEDIEKGRVGAVTLYAESDSTILFYMDLNRGASSYNMGSLYGRVTLKGDSGTFFKGVDSQTCKINFKFSKNKLNLVSFDDASCEFGSGVYAQGEFRNNTKNTPISFVNAEGTEFIFSETSPEAYYKRE